MTLDVEQHVRASCAVFCPQSKPTGEDYLNELLSFIRANKDLEPLIQAMSGLQEVWFTLVQSNKRIVDLSRGVVHLQNLSRWIETGDSSKIAGCMSGIISLPLLVIMQTCQYLQFLNLYEMSHSEFLAQLRFRGGIQGYCGGLPTAFAIACSKNEAEVVANCTLAVRIALAIGIYSELGDDGSIPGATTIVVRLKTAGQGEEMIAKYPGLYISAITDPKTISIVGPVNLILKFQTYAREQGLLVQEMHIRGKVHNPENTDLASELCRLCEETEFLRLPGAHELQCPVKSNKTGDLITKGSLTSEAIMVILASRCEWHRLLTNVANDLDTFGCQKHNIAMFGIGDCVPLSPFHERGLQITKLDVQTLVSKKHVDNIAKAASDYVYPEHAIAIIGASCRLPGADNLKELWDLLVRGESQHKDVDESRFQIYDNFRASQDRRFVDKRRFFGNFIDQVDSYDHEFFSTNPKEAINMDPQQRLLLELAFQAVDSSGYLATHNRDSGDDVGCFIGASFIEYLDNTNAHPPTAYTSTGTIRAFLSGKISHFFGWTGPSEILDTACSSSLVAINRACQSLHAGECSMALAGGVNVMTGVNNFLDLAKAGFLSNTGQCKPFDAAADGYCRSEGGGLVVLKHLDQALLAKDQILGVIPGIAHNQGGLSKSLTVPHSPLQQKLYQKVMFQAGMDANHVTYVEAHGTGTQVGDPVEMESIRAVFGGKDRSQVLSIGSVKGNIGHMETAAGVAGLLKILAMIQNAGIPAQASHERLNPKIAPLAKDKMEVVSRTSPWKAALMAACVNSYGAAGSNCALICCQGPKESSSSYEHAETSHPVIVSGMHQESLHENMKSLGQFIETSPETQISDLSYTLSRRRKLHHLAFATSAARPQNLAQMLKNGQGSFFQKPSNPRKIVLVFGGQSKCTVNMPEALYQTYPRIRYYIDECDVILQNLGHPALLPSIFQTKPLTSIVVLQCATFAMQYACARCWIDAGLEVATVVGHSFGELTAIVISGALSLRDGLKLIASRAVLMETKWGSEKGVMLAVHGDWRLVENMISIVNLECGALRAKVEIACFNAPSSHVLVGTVAAIECTENILRTDLRFSSLKNQRLNVTHGFHSSFTDPILDELTQVSASLNWAEPTIPLETCTAKSNTKLSQTRPAMHAREPVFFWDAVQRVEQNLGPCFWLEAGMGSPITSMVKRAVATSEKHVFQNLTPSQSWDVSKIISDVTINLWREGLPISYWTFVPPHQHPFRQIWLPPYRFRQIKHWIPNVDRAMEVQRTVATQKVIYSPEKPQGLIKAKSGDVFEICLESRRFTKILTGHAVRSKPLCPASLYMESATMALQLRKGQEQIGPLRFVNTCFQAALGTDLDREVSLILEPSPDANVWGFVIKSSSKTNRRSKVLTHAKGTIMQPDRYEFDLYERLLGDRVDELRKRSNVEILGSKRAYSLFSRVVRYAGFFQGISHIALDENEAVATINPLEESRFGLDESSVTQSFDSVVIDMFIQVVGLLINSGHLVTDEDVYVATSIDSLSLSPTCEFVGPSSWTVYSKFALVSESQVSGDIFVTTGGHLAVAILGVKFSKLLISKLERLLNSANQKLPLKTTTEVEQLSDNGLQSSKMRNAAYSESTALTPPSTSSTSSDSRKAQNYQRAVQMLSDISGAPIDAITNKNTLQEIGMDSLSAVELKGDLERSFEVEIEDDQLNLDSTVEMVLDLLNIRDRSPDQEEFIGKKDEQEPSSPIENAVTSVPAEKSETIELASPLDALTQYQVSFENNAADKGFSNYWKGVAPEQDELILAYICEALEALGSNLTMVKSGQQFKPINHLPRHGKVVERLLNILKKHDLIVEQESILVRGWRNLSSKRSPELHQDFVSRFPSYAVEARLMALTGRELAKCLTGEIDPKNLMFQGAAAQEIMEEYYTGSPMLSTLTEQLVDFIHSVVASSRTSGIPVRILEVGAGFGGTTTRLAETLCLSGFPVEYTFTDVSAWLVKRARAKFGKYKWMTFQMLNMEHEVPGCMQGTFDVIIGTNCVHATTKRVETIRRLKTLLNEQGFVVLSEVTQVVDWYDIVFGLLDGWWLATDGSTYPLQPVNSWVESFEDAGFDSDKIGYSVGLTQESNTQRLLVASNKHTRVERLPKRSSMRRDVQTVVYKEVGATKIEADIYLPTSAPNEPMPIALMIHGGGYVTLSRKAVRPNQTSFLLARNILPVSIDYRLCPEINLIDGPIEDVGDAYTWIKTGGLQRAVRSRGIQIDVEKTVVIGWSTGGHLAMTTAWTSKEAGSEPPVAILSFYGPTDFESGDLDKSRRNDCPEREMSIEGILSSLSPEPITSYVANPDAADESHLGWLRTNDPRSELVLFLLQEGHGLPLLLHGIDRRENGSYQDLPDPGLVASISPLSHVREGSYKTPTFLVHGTEDQIVPFHTAQTFLAALKEADVKCGLSIVEGARHIHDFTLREGDKGWSQGAGIGYEFLFKELGLGR